MKLQFALLAATMLALPSLAMAQPVSGLYVGAGAGASLAPVQKDVGTRGGSSRIKTDPGYMFSGNVGYGFGNGFRAEVQGDWRENSLKHTTGNKEQFGGFVNGLYDFNNLGPVAMGAVPYVGLGVGYEQLRLRSHGQNPTDGGFATQAIAGAAYNISSVPGLAVTGEYRFGVVPENLSLNFGRVGTHTAPTYDHSFLLGVRYAFGSAATPVTTPGVPVVAPAASRSYIVFFDFDRSDLTGRAREIVAAAAQASSSSRASRIEVDGYTDRAGTRTYNQALSVRRAQSVAAELVKNGVPGSEIAIVGHGESSPMVPTADGVREPQNRRVTIVIK